MIAKLYIISESFQYIDSSKEDIEKKIKSFVEDFDAIREHKDRNKIYKNNDIHEILFYPEMTLSDFLYTDKGKREFDKDVILSLLTIFDKSENTDETTEHIKNNLLPNHNADNCYGVIGFNEIGGLISDYQIIYSESDWYKFRRHFLGLYPKDAEFYIEECKIYFPKLFFHERNKETIKEILDDCPKGIIKHLSALNNNFSEYKNQKDLHRQGRLEHFSRACDLDEIASLEGVPDHKPNFTFKFITDNNPPVEVDVCCEPHMKLPYKDKRDGSYSTDRRIHFHEGLPNVANGNILVGHIGGHL